MAAFVKAHHNPFLLNLDYASGFHEFAIQLFRRSGFKTMELLGQPAVAAVGQNGQRSIQIDIEPHFTGQTIEVKEVDADTECVLNTIASGVAHDQRACTLFGVVGKNSVGRSRPKPITATWRTPPT